jgi:hypothetical protein
MMYFVTLVQDISHHLRRWSIHNRRRDNVRHIPRIPILRYVQLLI